MRPQFATERRYVVLKSTRALLNILLAFGILGFACASSGKIVGTIYVIGNEPFTSVAIEDAGGKMYRIAASKELEQRLRGLQGKKVEVEYTKLTPSPEGQTITVRVVKEVHQ